MPPLLPLAHMCLLIDSVMQDILRHHYQQLSADPGSLANLDQDLPNNLQREVPIVSVIAPFGVRTCALTFAPVLAS